MQDVGPHTPASVSRIASAGNHGQRQGNIRRDVSRAAPDMLRTEVLGCFESPVNSIESSLSPYLYSTIYLSIYVYHDLGFRVYG